MAEPTIDAERRASVIEPLPVPDLVARRILTAFRRRDGILPSPAVNLPEALCELTA